ncbi:PREDICTED: tubulin-specific chaperone C [Nanorana parkeri]|uniref:tubulin-specific chaperone C n=1 Tax=Nanorana parkeri TaxID=125878 RepID=UPI000854E150|nr:PREDICTED: tubulin-specific chaperone C [Nanorana parkeri]
MDAGAAERPHVLERLQRRDEERQREVEKRRQVKEEQVVQEEKSGYFSASFGQERAAIEEALSGEGGIELLEEVAMRIQGLQKLLNDSVMFLPSYDTRQAQDQLVRLQSALDARRLEIQPKKKFAFKSRKKEGTAATTDQLATPGPAKEIQVQSLPQCGFQGLTGQVLFMDAQQIRQKDVQLSQLRDCTITMTGSPATLHLRELNGCRLLCGPISTSVFVDNCHNCLFSFPCQQLRTHSTRDSRFYLHVTSRAIIEDCMNLTFAPFTWSYPDILADYELAGLDRGRNNWDQVDDFNWLAMGEESPNWSVIPEEERVTHWK